MAKSNNVYKDAYNKGLGLLETTGNLPSEPELGAMLGVSRTTVRSILARMEETGLIEWNKREKKVLRSPGADDFFPEEETDSLSQIIERSFMRRLLESGAEAGTQINELELAREIGVGTTSVREFLIRFSRFGLIEKRRNSHWVLKGFNRAFALELTEIREMFELRSAAAFVDLPQDSPVWAELDALEAEHHALAGAIATRFTAFSELDERLHRLIHVVPRDELLTLGMFLILVGIVLPLVPHQQVSRLTPLTPYGVWLAVVTVCSLSYLSYLLQRYAPIKHAALLPAMLGGAYSSTATTVVRASRIRRARAREQNAPCLRGTRRSLALFRSRTHRRRSQECRRRSGGSHQAGPPRKGDRSPSGSTAARG